MFDRAGAPLALRAPGPDRLVYALAGGYRLLLGAILAVVLAALAVAGARPGGLTWALLAILTLAVLYQEEWVFDAGRGRVTHRVGLVGAARSTGIDFTRIERFRIVPQVQGTIPGSEDERVENAAALRGARGDDGRAHRASQRKPFLALVLECRGGERYLLDRVPVRLAGQLRGTSVRLAELCRKPLVEGE